MGLIETEGLVLKSYGLAEADKIVVFLTREHGLVRGVAKGAKRLKSKFGSALEPCTIVRLSYFHKEERELVSIRDAELIRSFFADAPSPEFFPVFSYIAELLSSFAPPSDPNERLYRMAKVCLETAADNPQQLPHTLFYFELWLLKLGGFLPSWESCDICGRELGEGGESTLMFNYQVACRSCRQSNSAQRVTSAGRSLVSLAQRVGPVTFLEETKDKSSEISYLSKILRQVISQVLGRETIVGSLSLTETLS